MPPVASEDEELEEPFEESTAREYREKHQHRRRGEAFVFDGEDEQERRRQRRKQKTRDSSRDRAREQSSREGGVASNGRGDVSGKKENPRAAAKDHRPGWLRKMF